jgi:thiamine biosynthesis lipoprotein
MSSSIQNAPIRKLKAHHHPVKLMGCGFVLTAVDVDPQRAWDALRAGVKEIERIEDIISSWRADSETTRINAYAGKQAVQVSRELFDLIERSLRISRLTSGAFDISGTLSRYYWNFNGEENEVLSDEKIAQLRRLIDYKLIKLDGKALTVFLKQEGMKIGFGGIGKGYAAYRAYQIMHAMGIQSGLINASGDLMCWGSPPQGGNWTINIPNPSDRNQALMQMEIPNGSVVTSGNHENYMLIGGEIFSHIIDPRTAWPVRDTKHVSVICPNPEFGDALATALSVLGHQEGIPLVNQLKGVECVITDHDGKRYYSNGLT